MIGAHTANALRGWSRSRRIAAALALGTLGVLTVGTLHREDSTPRTSAAGMAGGSDSATDSQLPGGSLTTGRSDDRSTGSAIASPGVAEPALPLRVTVTNTSGLRAGDDVRIAVVADEGSLIYAVEARLCKQGTIVRNDGDMRPTVTGQCAAHPLSPGASGYLQQAADAPFKEMVAAFRVGVGTDTFPLDDGGMGAVTCDHDHPCVLAVKYQVPNGFRFRTYSVTFA